MSGPLLTLDSVPDAVVAIDAEYVIRYWNDAAERMFMFSREAAIGQHVIDTLTAVSDMGGARVEWHRALADRTPMFSAQARRADGSPVYAQCALTAPSPSLTVLSIRDMTQEEEELRRKNEFLANMSHELRTPLNAIIGFTEILHDGKVGSVSPEQREYLGDVLSSAKHLLQLINDVLDLAKVESGTLQFRAESIDVATLVTEVRDVLRPQLNKKHMRVVTEIDPFIDTIIGDPSKLKHVLYDYLSNAIKFTPEDSTITIRVLADATHTFRVEVAAKKYQGTGLGLALTKRIVEAQGGRVGFRRASGGGATFFAILPRIAGARERERVPATAGPKDPLILIIEDNDAERETFRAALTGAGYAVDEARSAAEGLQCCRERRYAAIMLDLLLPDMSGHHILNVLRADGPNVATPVIVVTQSQHHGLRPGYHVADVLQKPAGRERLLAAFARAGVAPGVVLVVDDDPRAIDLAAALLERDGYLVCGTGDAREALAAAAREPLAAVILDLVMPEMDGFEFLEQFRGEPANRDVPVIVWSAKDLSDAERARLSGTTQQFVPKSADSERLIAELRVLAPLSSGHGE